MHKRCLYGFILRFFIPSPNTSYSMFHSNQTWFSDFLPSGLNWSFPHPVYWEAGWVWVQWLLLSGYISAWRYSKVVKYSSANYSTSPEKPCPTSLCVIRCRGPFSHANLHPGPVLMCLLSHRRIPPETWIIYHFFCTQVWNMVGTRFIHLFIYLFEYFPLVPELNYWRMVLFRCIACHHVEMSAEVPFYTFIHLCLFI